MKIKESFNNQKKMSEIAGRQIVILLITLILTLKY